MTFFEDNHLPGSTMIPNTNSIENTPTKNQLGKAYPPTAYSTVPIAGPHMSPIPSASSTQATYILTFSGNKELNIAKVVT